MLHSLRLRSFLVFFSPDSSPPCKTAKSVGREFFIGFLQLPQMESVNELHIAGAARSQSRVTITTPGVFSGPVQKELTGDHQFGIVSLKKMDDTSPVATLIQSTSDISVVGVVAGNNTGAFLALPTDALGTEYYVATYNIAPRVHRAKRGNEFIIIGTTQDTVVEVTLVGSARYEGETYANGSRVQITINRLDIARFVSKTDDLTGTHIIATQPIAVTSGSKCADVPVTSRYCDHLVEQMPPFHFWGSHFVTTPLAEREGGDIFRVMAGRNGTNVTINNEWHTVLNAGEFFERSVPSNVSWTITGSKPILVLQYSKGGSTDKTNADPSMMVVPALEQYFTEALFAPVDLSPDTSRLSSYLNIVLQCELIPYLNQNMFPVHPTIFQEFVSFNVSIAGRNMCSAHIRLNRGENHFFQFEELPDATLSLLRYGHAVGDIATSYGLPVGFSFNDNTCFDLSNNLLSVPRSWTNSPGTSGIPPIDSPRFPHYPNSMTTMDGLLLSEDKQPPDQSNILAIFLIIFIISLIIVTLLIGYVVILKRRIETLEVEKKKFISVPVTVGFDGYIGLDGSQIAHREYMTLNNSEEMWHLNNRRSDRSVFRGIQPAHSIRSHSSQVSSTPPRRVGGSRQQSIQSQSERVFERDTVELMSRDPSTPSRHTSQTDFFGNVNPAYNDAISISSQQEGIGDIVSQPSSQYTPIRPVRRHHSHMEGFNTTTPVPKPRYHGSRALRRSISTPGEHLFGGPMKVYYHVPRGEPVHAYDRPRNRTCSEGISPSAAAILLPPEEGDSKACSRKSSSIESDSSLPPQQDDGYMSMKEARVSTISRGSHSGESSSRKVSGATYSDANHNKREPFDEDSTEYTELF